MTHAMTLLPDAPAPPVVDPRIAPMGGAPTSLDVAALVAAHADFVWRSLRRLGVPAASADDATQQVFLVAQSKLPQIVEGRERGFLFGVAMNVAAHVRRS